MLPPLSELKALSIGSLSLTPTFESNVKHYEAVTTNATNKVKVETLNADDVVSITVNGTAIDNNASASWNAGENEVVINVNGTVYSVIVTKN